MVVEPPLRCGSSVSRLQNTAEVIFASETGVEVLTLSQPVRREHPFDAATSDIADMSRRIADRRIEHGNFKLVAAERT